MAYTWTGENWGRSLCKDAVEAGFAVRVTYDDDVLYKGNSWKKAWEAVTSVDECYVSVLRDGKCEGTAFIVLEKDQRGDEVINDTSTNDWVSQWWDAKFASQEA